MSQGSQTSGLLPSTFGSTTISAVSWLTTIAYTSALSASVSPVVTPATM